MPCNQDNFDDVWAAFDKTAKGTESFRCPRAALDDMVRCAVEHGQGDPGRIGVGNAAENILAGLLSAKPREGSSTYEVRREAMWVFLKDHTY
jgi:hypothetical protein